MVAIKGIGEVKAIQLIAAIELGRRLAQKHNDEKFTIRSPQDAATYLMPDMTSLNQEHFVVLFLNIKNQIIHKQTIFIGSLNVHRSSKGNLSRSCQKVCRFHYMCPQPSKWGTNTKHRGH